MHSHSLEQSPAASAPCRNVAAPSYLDAKPARRALISRNVLSHVDLVDIDGSLYAMKRFAMGAHLFWARETASHFVCARPEVPALQSYGVDAQHRGWLCTHWIDAPNARDRLSRGDGDLRKSAQAWIARFQRQLEILGFRWMDAAMRNLLVLGEGTATCPYEFKVVDYTVRSLDDPSALDSQVARLMSLQPGDREVRVPLSRGWSAA